MGAAPRSPSPCRRDLPQWASIQFAFELSGVFPLSPCSVTLLVIIYSYFESLSCEIFAIILEYDSNDRKPSNSSKVMRTTIKPIHPFPARMAPELIWDELPDHSPRRLRVLDPMAGSGTTLVTAKLRGHQAIGYDRDPLAVLIARSWLANVKTDDVERKAAKLLAKARSRARDIKIADAYPRSADDETRAFVRYWFDTTNRIQLTVLSESISRLHDASLRDLMWCAFSRLIITKNIGVSLAMDISHSRPHRSYEKAPVNAFDRFKRAVYQVIKSSPFSKHDVHHPAGSMDLADARKLPIGNRSVDMVITSPPYLNAIDYLRGHKFSLSGKDMALKSFAVFAPPTWGRNVLPRRTKATLQPNTLWK